MTTSTTGPNAERATRIRPRAAGFTLLELVLVMVIICTVLAMASVSLRGFFGSRRTADAAGQILTLTQFARSRAVAEGRAYRLHVDADAGRYWLTAPEDGVHDALRCEFGRVFRLPEGTTAAWIDSPQTALCGWIAFYPDGRADAAHLRLAGRRGETADILCASAAQPYRIAARTGGVPR